MFGRELVDERHNLASVADPQRHVRRPAVRLQSVAHVLGETQPRRDQNRARRWVVLGLCGQVCGNPFCRSIVGPNDDFAWTRAEINCAIRRHQHLGRGDPGITGSNDLVDRCE
jgi:hypothetical protein